MRAYIDSNVMIWHLRGKIEALKFFQRLRDSREYDLWTSAIQRAEIVFFMRPEEEDLTLKFLSFIRTEVVDQSVIDAAGIIFRRWHPSHQIDVNDAILAATVQKTGGKIYTLNLKHFPMPDIIVEQAW